MNCLKKLSEKCLIRRIERLREEGGEPFVKKLHKAVLYEEDAYEILRYYVNLSTQTPLHGKPYDRKSNLLKLACGCQNDPNHYWLYFADGLYYAVQIGLKSKIFIGRTVCVPYVELSFAYLKVQLKDCRWQLGVPSRLYGYFVYSAAGLEPIALMLEGRDVEAEGFDESVWGARVEYEPKPHHLEGFSNQGIKGKWYDVWFSIAKRGPIYDEEEAEHLPINGHERWWKGEKIIRQLKKNERPTLKDMMVIWNQFRNSV